LLCSVSSCFSSANHSGQQNRRSASAGERTERTVRPIQFKPSGTRSKPSSINSTPTTSNWPRISKSKLPQKTADLQRQKGDLQKQLDQALGGFPSAQTHRLAAPAFPRAAAGQGPVERAELASAWASVSKDPFATMRMTTLKPSDDAAAKALAASIWDIRAAEGHAGRRRPQYAARQQNLSDLGIRCAVPRSTHQRRPLQRGPNRVPPASNSPGSHARGDISRVIISTERRGGRDCPNQVLLFEQLMRRGFRHTAGLQLQMRLLAR